MSAPHPASPSLPKDTMLTTNERKVLELRFGLGSDDASSGMTLVEIASRLGVTPQRASQLEASALAKMRAAMRARGIVSMDDVV
jgi:DNA-directed RNA polymerase sigma subunit (sigma70/sigma32)